jgi:hypothetical protein
MLSLLKTRLEYRGDTRKQAQIFIRRMLEEVVKKCENGVPGELR